MYRDEGRQACALEIGGTHPDILSSHNFKFDPNIGPINAPNVKVYVLEHNQTLSRVLTNPYHLF